MSLELKPIHLKLYTTRSRWMILTKSGTRSATKAICSDFVWNARGAGYLKRHPKHARTVMLQGVAPTNQFMPRDFAQVNERALQGVLAECAR